MIGDGDRAFDPKYRSEFAKKFREKYTQWKKDSKYQKRNQQVFADLVRDLEYKGGETGGCGKNSISDYLQGKTVPTKRRLRSIAEVLGCDVSELLPFGHDELYKYSQDFINQYGDELSQYAQKVGLSLFLVRGLREIVPDYDESFPVFRPIRFNPNPFCDLEEKIIRMPIETASDSARMNVSNELFQIQRGEKTISMSYCDVNFLKALQDEIVSVVERAFAMREKEMVEETQRINDSFLKKHTNEDGSIGISYPIKLDEQKGLFELLKYSKKLTEGN